MKKSSDYYQAINRMVPYFKPGEHRDFTLDEKREKEVHLTEQGYEKRTRRAADQIRFIKK